MREKQIMTFIIKLPDSNPEGPKRDYLLSSIIQQKRYEHLMLQ